MRKDLFVDLSYLHKHCVFRSYTRKDSYDHVAKELTEHNLRWSHGAVNTSLFKADGASIGLYMLHYGPEVEIAPRPYDDFLVMHMSLEGHAEAISDGHRIAVPQGRGALINSRKNLRLTWQEGSRHLLLKIPHSLFQSQTQNSPDVSWSSIAPASLLPQDADFQWRLLLQALLNSLTLPGEVHTRRSWLDHFERAIAQFLLEQAGGTWPTMPGMDGDAKSWDTGVSGDHPGSTDLKRFEALEAYMQAKLAAPVSLDDLANAVGLSPRMLNMLCQRVCKTSPMQHLKNMRLDAARRQLQSGQTTVTRAAVEFGFMHLGRFSSFYRQRFNELPKETLGDGKS